MCKHSCKDQKRNHVNAVNVNKQPCNSETPLTHSYANVETTVEYLEHS